MKFDIAISTITHFDQLFAEMKDAIARIPEKSWNLEPMKGWELTNPSICAFHAIFSMSYPHMFHLPLVREKYEKISDWATVKPKETVVHILKEISQGFHEKFGKMPAEQFMQQLQGHQDVTYDQILYTVAHARYHLGQLSQLMKNQQIEEPKWYPLPD